MIKLVILESPYAGDVEAHLAYARKAARHCAFQGESVLASHLLFTQFLDDKNPKERELGIELGLAWRARASYSVFYTDFGWSNGMKRALASALRDHQSFRLRAFGVLEIPKTRDLVEIYPLANQRYQEIDWNAAIHRNLEQVEEIA